MKNTIFKNELIVNVLDKIAKNEKLTNESIDKDFVIFDLLFQVFGDLDFINPYITRDEKALVINMMKYGASEEFVYNFFAKLSNYYTSRENNDLYILGVDLVEMFFQKRKVVLLSQDKLLNFTRDLAKLENAELLQYFKEKLVVPEKKEEIELLDAEIKIDDEKNNLESLNNGYNFRLSAARGYVNIIAILCVILAICIGLILVNIFVG